MNDKKLVKKSVKFKAVIHSEFPRACNKFMIANGFGAICGGNLHQFIINGDKRLRNICPTSFNSRAAIHRYMAINGAYLKEMAEYCASLKPAKTQGWKV